MSDQEQSRSSPAGKHRHGYRPAIVLFVILAAVVIGVVLKFNKQRTPITAQEQTTSESQEPAVPK